MDITIKNTRTNTDAEITLTDEQALSFQRLGYVQISEAQYLAAGADSILIQTNPVVYESAGKFWVESNN